MVLNDNHKHINHGDFNLQDDWLEVSHSILAFWEKGPLKPCSEAKSALYYAVCPQEQMTECTLLVKVVVCGHLHQL